MWWCDNFDGARYGVPRFLEWSTKSNSFGHNELAYQHVFGEKKEEKKTWSSEIEISSKLISASLVWHVYTHVGQRDHDVDHLDPGLPFMRSCAPILCIRRVQIQPRKAVLNHTDYTAPTRQHEQDHTRYRSGIYLTHVDHAVEVGDLSWCVIIPVYYNELCLLLLL